MAEQLPLEEQSEFSRIFLFCFRCTQGRLKLQSLWCCDAKGVLINPHLEASLMVPTPASQCPKVCLKLLMPLRLSLLVCEMGKIRCVRFIGPL